MRRRNPGSLAASGNATVEAAIVGALLLIALLAPAPGLPARLVAALDDALARFVAALGAPLP